MPDRQPGPDPTPANAPTPGSGQPVEPDAVPGVEVLAGGGLVWRSGTDPHGGSAVQMLVVHRPRYDDWSLPKGKLDDGETLAECAVREVEEETGLRCALGPHLVDVRYTDHRGRSKLARYWAMTVETEGHEPDGEVDDMRWTSAVEARELLTYPHDHGVIDAFEQVFDELV